MKPKKSAKVIKRVSLKQANLLAAHLKKQPMTRKTQFPKKVTDADKDGM